MSISIPLVWSEAHRRHAPETAVWIGVPIEGDELPERADRIRATLEDSPLEVTEYGFCEAGRRIGALGVRTVVLQEGGYVLDTVGPPVHATLEGLEDGAQ